MKSFEDLLLSSAKAHGHLCPGQAVGVRMAMLGCRLIGLDEPSRPDQIKKLIVYVEMDRCTADAIAHRGIIDDDINFLQKPFSNKALADKVREVLDHKM